MPYVSAPEMDISSVQSAARTDALSNTLVAAGGSEEIMSELAVKQSMKLWSMTSQVLAKMKKARSKAPPTARM